MTGPRFCYKTKKTTRWKKSRHRGACKHCGKFRVLRPRGLCPVCYGERAESSGVRHLYAVADERSVVPQDFHGEAPLPEPIREPLDPLNHMLVLMNRAASGQALRHPDDYRAPD